MSPRRLPVLAVAALVALAAPPAARAAVIIQVTPALGPNVFGSPSYDAYRDNAVGALAAGQSQAGVAGTPAYYQALAAGAPVSVADLIVTDFASWRGDANPTGAFAAETGTRLYFGLAITATAGETFSIADLSFSATSSDPFGTLDFDIPAGFYSYSQDYVGVRADGTLVTSGTEQVVAIYGRGASNAFEILSSDPGATNQSRIDQFVNTRPGFTYTGTYTLGGASGGASVDVVSPVPAPASWVGMAVGGAVLAARRRR